MKFAGVVITYNPTEIVLNNIDTYIDYIDKLYVIDNSDSDNSELFKDKKKIEYICNCENLGIAKALNMGAKMALKDKYDWLLTMDQDSSFNVGALDKMKKFILNIKNDKNIVDLLGVNYNKIGLVAPYYKLNENDSGTFGIGFPLMVMTSGNLINLNIYKKIGGYKDWLFIDCVDFDYCLNLKQNGYEIVQLNTAILNHHLGNNKNYKFLWMNKSSSNHPAIRRYYMVRNRHYINDMYHDMFPDYCRLELSRTKVEAMKIILFEKDKVKKISYMIKGYRDYKNGKKGALVNEKK